MADLLIIGALALDRPIRLSSPLAPGARLAGHTLGGRLEPRLGGGAANAGVALLNAGHHVRVAASVASDADGDRLRAMAACAGLDITLVSRRPGHSRMTLILIDPTGERAVLGLDPAGLSALPSIASPDGNPGIRPDGLFVRAPYPCAERWAARCKGPVIAHWPGAYAGPADVLVASADDLDSDALAAPYDAGRAAIGERLSWVVVTRGAAGATAYGPTFEVRVKAPPAVARDTTGAGDIFAAGLLDALVAGAEMEAALAHACAWGSVAVTLDTSAPADAPAGTFTRYGDDPSSENPPPPAGEGDREAVEGA